MTEDPFTGKQWEDFVTSAREDLVPKLRDSAISMSLLPRGEPDVKFAVELGMSILLDKPIIVVVRPGVRVPDHVVRVADEIVEADLSSESAQPRIQAAITRVLNTLPPEEPS